MPPRAILFSEESQFKIKAGAAPHLRRGLRARGGGARGGGGGVQARRELAERGQLLRHQLGVRAQLALRLRTHHRGRQRPL